MGEEVGLYWPQRTRSYFCGFTCLCPIWWKSTKKCDHESVHRPTDTRTHTRTDAKRFYYLSHAICYSYGADNKMPRYFMFSTISMPGTDGGKWFRKKVRAYGKQYLFLFKFNAILLSMARCYMFYFTSNSDISLLWYEEIEDSFKILGPNHILWTGWSQTRQFVLSRNAILA